MEDWKIGRLEDGRLEVGRLKIEDGKMGRFKNVVFIFSLREQQINFLKAKKKGNINWYPLDYYKIEFISMKQSQTYATR